MDIHKYTYICSVVFVMLGACTTGKYILYALYMHRVGHIMYRTAICISRAWSDIGSSCMVAALQRGCSVYCVYIVLLAIGFRERARELASIIT